MNWYGFPDVKEPVQLTCEVLFWKNEPEAHVVRDMEPELQNVPELQAIWD